MARATINDVAAAAGVSVATVSRALRGLPNVSEKTRRKVEDAAASLQYVADSRASSLASGRTNIVGLAAPDFGSWYISQTVAGVEKGLADEGYDLLVLGVPRSADRTEVFADRLATRRMDGLLLVDYFVDERARQVLLTDVGLPIVVMGETLDGLTSLTIDNIKGGRMLMTHLLHLGHQDVVYIGGNPPGQNAAADALRREGARAANDEAGLAELRVCEVAYSIDGGRDGWSLIDAMDPTPTAVLCGSDEIAIGFMAEARRQGTVIPDEISIIGFDDHEMADTLGLTTVRQAVRANGARAAELLLERIANPDLPTSAHKAELTLVKRATTASPRRIPR